jgi:hypothetical protein
MKTFKDGQKDKDRRFQKLTEKNNLEQRKSLRDKHFHVVDEDEDEDDYFMKDENE